MSPSTADVVPDGPRDRAQTRWQIAQDTVSRVCRKEASPGRLGRSTRSPRKRSFARGAHDVGFASTWLFGAVCPERGATTRLILPEVSTATMNRFLPAVGAAVSPETHAVLVLDRAGWHTSRGLALPPNRTRVYLPPYAPELNPVEKLWQFLRERLLSHRVFHDLGAVIDATCAAWNRRVAAPGRVRSRTRFPWLPASVSTS